MSHMIVRVGPELMMFCTVLYFRAHLSYKIVRYFQEFHLLTWVNQNAWGQYFFSYVALYNLVCFKQFVNVPLCSERRCDFFREGHVELSGQRLASPTRIVPWCVLDGLVDVWSSFLAAADFDVRVQRRVRPSQTPKHNTTGCVGMVKLLQSRRLSWCLRPSGG